MEKDNIEWLNSYLTVQDGIILRDNFKIEDNKIRGSVSLNASPKELLSFKVEIPLSYPLIEEGKKCCRFLIENKVSCKHINEDRTICLVIPTCFDFKKRFELEIAALKEWRDKYYVAELEDDRYDYPIVPNQNMITFLFSNTTHKFVKGDNGTIKGRLIAKYSVEVEIATWLVTQFDNIKCEWKESKKDEILGLYYFIGVEPSAKKGILHSSWRDLDSYLRNTFKEKLLNNLSQSKTNLNYLFLGFKINETEEIHWLALRIQGIGMFIETKQYERNVFLYNFLDVPIIWCKTQNANYDRYFGRGAISENLKNKKILIIGIGAIGSSLARILVRTGVLDLSLSDYDIVEAGNICRGEFNLLDIGLPKVFTVRGELEAISPFVSISGILFDKLKQLNDADINDNRKKLNQFDIIFNCTADDESIYAIDKIRPRGVVINLSITNKAQQLMCFTGNNIMEQVLMFNPNVDKENVKYYEGTGCWNWTFQAAYFDINAMIHLAIKNINNRFFESKSLKSFVVKYITDDYENLVINGI